MSSPHSKRSSVLSGKDLQQETWHCAFCDQPSSQLNWFSVSCIEESSLTYRWTRWITKDPKKLKLCFALSSSIPAAIFCWAIFVTDDQSRLFFLLPGLVFFSLFFLQPLSGLDGDGSSATSLWQAPRHPRDWEWITRAKIANRMVVRKQASSSTDLWKFFNVHGSYSHLRSLCGKWG